MKKTSIIITILMISLVLLSTLCACDSDEDALVGTYVSDFTQSEASQVVDIKFYDVTWEDIDGHIFIDGRIFERITISIERITRKECENSNRMNVIRDKKGIKKYYYRIDLKIKFAGEEEQLCDLNFYPHPLAKIQVPWEFNTSFSNDNYIVFADLCPVPFRNNCLEFGFNVETPHSDRVYKNYIILQKEN